MFFGRRQVFIFAHVTGALSSPVKIAPVSATQVLFKEAMGRVVLLVAPSAAEFCLIVPIAEVQQAVFPGTFLVLQVPVEHFVQPTVVAKVLVRVCWRTVAEDPRAANAFWTALGQ